MKRRLLIPAAATCTASDPTLDSGGWVPVGYDATGVGPRVIWANRPNLDAPFFPKIALTRWQPEAGQFMQTDFAAVVRRANSLPSAVPAGLIFHISRCGSTLISNLARCDDRAVVLSEPSSSVSGLFSPEMQNITPRSRTEVLRALIRLFGYRTGFQDGVERRVVIKFTAWDSLWVQEIRAVWPEVPALFLIRNPAEVVVSNLRKPATWITERFVPKRAREFIELPDGFDRFEISNSELIALSLGAQCEALARSMDDKCLVMDYENIGLGTAVVLAQWLGLDIEANRTAAEMVFNTYSKDPSKTTQFADDREKKREQVSPRIEEMVAKWVANPYRRLHERRYATARDTEAAVDVVS